MKKQLQVFENESEAVIAYDITDAIKVWEETVGEKWTDHNDDGDIEWYPANRSRWRIRYESFEDMEDGLPDGDDVIIEYDGEDGYIVDATQDQWIEKMGRGYFWSSEY